MSPTILPMKACSFDSSTALAWGVVTAVAIVYLLSRNSRALALFASGRTFTSDDWASAPCQFQR